MLGARRAAIALTVLLASCLSWVIYLLLARAKLGSPTECFALAQVCVVLLAAPYLAAYTSRTEDDSVLLTLSRISTRRTLVDATRHESDAALVLGVSINGVSFLLHGTTVREGIANAHRARHLQFFGGRSRHVGREGFSRCALQHRICVSPLVRNNRRHVFTGTLGALH